jgi:hypothetical protein
MNEVGETCRQETYQGLPPLFLIPGEGNAWVDDHENILLRITPLDKRPQEFLRQL